MRKALHFALFALVLFRLSPISPLDKLHNYRGAENHTTGKWAGQGSFTSPASNQHIKPLCRSCVNSEYKVIFTTDPPM